VARRAGRDATATPCAMVSQPAFSAASARTPWRGVSCREGQPIGDRILFAALPARHELSTTNTLSTADAAQNAVGSPQAPPQISTCMFGGHRQIDRALRGVGVETIVEQRRSPSRDHRGPRNDDSRRPASLASSAAESRRTRWDDKCQLISSSRVPHDLQGRRHVGDLDGE